MKTIEIKDVGPIEHLAVPLPEGGGITVFRGRNDSGKSLSIGATERLCGGDVKLTQRDGSDEPGSVEGLGMTFRVGQSRTSGKGELLATSIAGKLNIGELIDPGIKEVKAADRARTKALCKLLGVEAKPELFRDAIGYTPDIEGTDIVEMQRQLKKRCDEKALEFERQAEHAAGQAAAFSEAPDIDLDAESDSPTLGAAMAKAIGDLAAISERKRGADEKATAAQLAQAKLSTANNAYTGPTIEQARSDTGLAASDATSDRDALALAKSSLAASEECFTKTQLILDAAKQHFATIASWQTTIDKAAQGDGPTDADIDAAIQHKEAASEAVELGVLIREHKARADEAKQHTENSNDLVKSAEKLRKAGKDTEKVLAQVVDADTLTLKGGRWMTKAMGRGEIPYHERSRGTKAAIALDLAARRAREMNPDGMVVIPFPQEVWEGLDPDNRQELAEQAKRLNVNLITAECSAGDVRCEVYGDVKKDK